ncbi:MAG: DUF3365 domain-containing protein [Lentisphaeraceae bacterium]|nr:DUF3365 domain-containing protein [Lentisphaeraceae bacterium]
MTKLIISLLIVISTVTSSLIAQDAAGNEKISIESTTLYRAARGVISKNQVHINDATKGDKGLSGDVVAKAALEGFEKLMKYKPTGKHIDAMVTAINEVMDKAQPLINEKDKGFKGFLPAIFAKQVADSFTKTMDGKMRIKLTAPKTYVRNRANRPDKWEHSIIEKKFKSGSWEKNKTFSEMEKYKGKDAFRFILPEYYKESCLKCHGSPKGDRDITGGKKEGGVLGELA